MANDNNNTNELVIDDDDSVGAPTGGGPMFRPHVKDSALCAGEADADDDIAKQAGRLACAEVEIEKLRAQLQRTEAYADDIRQRLQDRSTESDRAIDSKEFLQVSLERTMTIVDQLERDLDESQRANSQLSRQLASIEDQHAAEIRMIRFELGEAQETLAQQELFTEQLASDLVVSRGSRDELKRKLTIAERSSKSRIEDLEREIRRLKDELHHSHEQLQGKSEAINGLLEELAKKSRKLDTIGSIEAAIDEIEENLNARGEDPVQRNREKVSRVLIGTVGGRELRFPLFKDRLTIGRTRQNDIQLKASYVSRRHAVIVADGDATRVIDWGSKNGVFVNAQRITEHFLANGDAVRIGTAEFRYEERQKREA